jgi:hypothetical protein
LLDGTDFETTNGAGSIDLNEVWPSGYDEVTALAAHNDYLLVFGQHSILVYHVPAGGSSISEVGPAYMTLEDTVNGIGCIARDSVQTIGTDIYFLDSTGVRAFKRTIQEKSLPLGDVSNNVTSKIRQATALEGRPVATGVKSFFYLEGYMYVLFFPASNLAYVFDTRMTLEDGSYRVTRWPSITMKCGSRSTSGDVLLGAVGGLYNYTGKKDLIWDGVTEGVTTTKSIQWKYWTHPLSFGEPARDKFPKQVDATLIGVTNTDVTLRWAYDYTNAKSASDKSIDAGPVFEYGTAEFGDDGEDQVTGATPCEFTGGGNLSYLRWNIWGHGRNIKLGFESAIRGTELAIQALNIQALLGRLQ